MIWVDLAKNFLGALATCDAKYADEVLSDNFTSYFNGSVVIEDKKVLIADIKGSEKGSLKIIDTAYADKTVFFECEIDSLYTAVIIKIDDYGKIKTLKFYG